VLLLHLKATTIHSRLTHQSAYQPINLQLDITSNQRQSIQLIWSTKALLWALQKPNNRSAVKPLTTPMRPFTQPKRLKLQFLLLRLLKPTFHLHLLYNHCRILIRLTGQLQYLLMVSIPKLLIDKLTIRIKRKCQMWPVCNCQSIKGYPVDKTQGSLCMANQSNLAHLHISSKPCRLSRTYGHSLC
jgi:hypothetical protein